MPDPDLLKAVLNTGSFALVSWLFFHTFTRLIPGLHDRLDRIGERFERALDQQHAECTEILERQQQRFDALLTEYRDIRKQELK